MKHTKKMRLHYCEEKDTFNIELLIDGEWTPSYMYHCVKKQGADDEDEPNFIHFEIVNRLNYCLELGYELVRY